MEPTAGVPCIILELSVDVLISSMEPLPLDALGEEEFSATRIDGHALERRTLRNMCLVHRSWTGIAQRALWHRAIVRAHELLVLNIHISTPHCMHIREIALIASGFYSRPYWRDFSDILRYSPNLCSLYIDVEVQKPKEPGFLDVLQQIRTLTKLERLWFVGDMDGCYEDIIVTVSTLQNLKSLVLDTVSSNGEGAGALQGLDMPRSLESIAVIDSLDWPYFSYLICPREGKAISNLSFALEQPEELEEDPDSVEQLYRCLRSLESLSITTSTTDREDELMIHNECIPSLLSKTQHLRRLTLTVTSMRTSQMWLPNSLTYLHIHYDSNLTGFLSKASEFRWREDDRNIASIISGTCPSNVSSLAMSNGMQEVVLSFIHDRLRADDRDVHTRLQNDAFPETHNACSLAGISLVFRTYASAYFGVLAETNKFIG